MANSSRAATSRQLEIKLKKALLELKASQELSERLLREREESEEEILKVMHKNTELKNELSELDIRYQDVLDQRDQLQKIVDTFHTCSDSHEQVLRRITELELELGEAYEQINKYQQDSELRESVEIKNLYEELVDSAPISASTIDQPRMIVSGSRRKSKKYLKLKKCVSKLEKTLKTKYLRNSRIKRQTHVKLQTELNICQAQLMQR